MSSQGSGPQPGAALRAVVESAPFGMHFYRLEAGGFVDQKRMLLVK